MFGLSTHHPLSRREIIGLCFRKSIDDGKAGAAFDVMAAFKLGNKGMLHHGPLVMSAGSAGTALHVGLAGHGLTTLCFVLSTGGTGA